MADSTHHALNERLPFRVAMPFWLSLSVIPVVLISAVLGGIWVVLPIVAAWTVFATLDEPGTGQGGDVISALGTGKAGKLLSAPLASPIDDFYLTNPVARASRIMAECSAMRSGALKQAAE